MTIKEIAELCGVGERAVRNWVISLKNVNKRKNVGCLQKLDELKQHETVDLPIETVVEIIRAGGRETLASLLAENAADKNAIAVQNDIIARLERIENAVNRSAEWVKQRKNQENWNDPQEPIALPGPNELRGGCYNVDGKEIYCYKGKIYPYRAAMMADIEWDYMTRGVSKGGRPRKNKQEGKDE